MCCRALASLGISLRPWRDAVVDYVTQELMPGRPRV
jgi:hypothetical protein